MAKLNFVMESNRLFASFMAATSSFAVKRQIQLAEQSAPAQRRGRVIKLPKALHRHSGDGQRQRAARLPTAVLKIVLQNFQAPF